jgi:hypothetical protein
MVAEQVASTRAAAPLVAAARAVWAAAWAEAVEAAAATQAAEAVGAGLVAAWAAWAGMAAMAATTAAERRVECTAAEVKGAAAVWTVAMGM